MNDLAGKVENRKEEFVTPEDNRKAKAKIKCIDDFYCDSGNK